MNEAAFYNFFLSRGYPEALYRQVKPAVDLLAPVAEADLGRFLQSPAERVRMLLPLETPDVPKEILIPVAECLAHFLPYERFWLTEPSAPAPDSDPTPAPAEKSEPAPEPVSEPHQNALPPKQTSGRPAPAKKDAPAGLRAFAPYPSDENIARVLENLRADPAFRETERLREALFREQSPMNNDSDVVLEKLAFIAKRYGVRVRDGHGLALRISYEAAEIDDCIYNGLDPAVEKLLGHSPLGGYELSTRYCWCHRPDLFPLMTRRCLRAMRYYRDTYQKGHFLDRDAADYYGYKQVLDRFLAVYDVRDYGRVSISLFLDTVGKALEEREK